ncbi:10191_t:CDS:2 [Funneliformis caledonium]|uniref:10191_t:CDS:1 n=1 Tax=Funneliformis caledonium TaxID=1117310 RepID=A0A9N8ZRI7_9GLOM|nr:10191_t:CDS:2 [Funneliformis caledonium]
MPLDSDYSDEEDYPKIQKTISDSSSLPLVLEERSEKFASERNKCILDATRVSLKAFIILKLSEVMRISGKLIALKIFG